MAKGYRNPAYIVWLRAIQIQLIWYGSGLYKSSLYGMDQGYTNPAYRVWLRAIQIQLDMLWLRAIQIQLDMVWLRAIQIQLIWYRLGLFKSSLCGLA